MKIIDAAYLLSSPPVQITWAVHNLLPASVTADVFGPPGAGKSTLLTDLALTVAGESGVWHGRACFGGGVVILGGERTDQGALSRDMHRTKRPAPPKGNLIIPVDDSGDCPPIFRWNKKAMEGAGRWELTTWGEKITEFLTGAAPVLVIIDTILSAAQGCDLLDQPQQYALGQYIRSWSKQIGEPVVISASHTNQASGGATIKLHERLDYLSRAGGNGFPGALRHLGGLTKIRPEESQMLGLSTDDRTMFAFGFSKHNESPPTDWTHYAPAIFSQKGGKIELVMEGQEVERLGELKERADAAVKSAKAQGNVKKAGSEDEDY
jgi:RecA-family ATPase